MYIVQYSVVGHVLERATAPACELQPWYGLSQVQLQVSFLKIICKSYLAYLHL
jgi:hypothetical protein